MQKPICTEPIAAFSYTVLELTRPVPVGVAGYRLREGRQYCLQVRSNDSSVLIQNVTLQNDENVEDHSGSGAETVIFTKRFKVLDSSWRTFLPFRFLSSTLTIRGEIDIKGGASRTIYVPIIIVQLLPAFNNLRLLWYACGLAILLGLPFFFSLIGIQVSAVWIQVSLFLGLLLSAPVIAIIWQFRTLKRRAKELRSLCLNDSEEEEDLVSDPALNL